MFTRTYVGKLVENLTPKLVIYVNKYTNYYVTN